MFNPYPRAAPKTASPRETLQSFQSNGREAVRRWNAREPAVSYERARARLAGTLDLSQLPPALRDEQGILLAIYLLEILGRIELPPVDEIPDAAMVEATGLTRWTIPNTEITIARTEEGPDAGRFQFTAHTIRQLPVFYERAEHLPYKPGALVGVYEDLSYSPGLWIPSAWTEALPRFAHTPVWGQTVWQWLATFLTLSLTGAIVAVIYLWGRRFDAVTVDAERRSQLCRLIATVAAVLLLHLASRFLDEGVNIGGIPQAVLETSLRGMQVVAMAWLILLVLDGIGELIIRLRRSVPGSVDVQLIRIVVRLIAMIILAYLALYLAESFGIPAAPLIASLGVGGLAIALAIRPTMENIVGGFILFADKPVRVGEFCRFGSEMGTVEQVGLRSTRLRALDRTVITVPNADFAQMQIVNFTRRDRMLMRTTLGLRYETTPDQLRYVLTKLRELFVAHPKVVPDPARVRFIGFGDSSLDIEIFIYVESADYSEFLGIAEDLNLRIMDIVADAGTGFAFPSQTAYLARDTGIDTERARAAESAVQGWRAEAMLPFPGLDPATVAALDGTLEYPPKGSVQHRQSATEAPAPQAARGQRWGRSPRPGKPA